MSLIQLPAEEHQTSAMISMSAHKHTHHRQKTFGQPWSTQPVRPIEVSGINLFMPDIRLCRISVYPDILFIRHNLVAGCDEHYIDTIAIRENRLNQSHQLSTIRWLDTGTYYIISSMECHGVARLYNKRIAPLILSVDRNNVNWRYSKLKLRFKVNHSIFPYFNFNFNFWVFLGFKVEIIFGRFNRFQ